MRFRLFKARQLILLCLGLSVVRQVGYYTSFTSARIRAMHIPIWYAYTQSLHFLVIYTGRSFNSYLFYRLHSSGTLLL